MFFWMVLLFTILPALEIWVFFTIPMSLAAKLLVVLCTGIAGASLARAQGTRVIREIQGQLQQGAMPTSELVEGGIVLFGGALLLTPGFLTDTIGFLCLLPPSRKVIAAGLKRSFAGRIQVAASPGFKAASFQTDARVRRPPPTPRAVPPKEAPRPDGNLGRVDMGAHAGAPVVGPKTIDASFSVVEEDD
jgi:UPF0716 protein FxsA